MTTKQVPKKRFLTVSRVVLTVILVVFCAIVWEGIKIFVFWPGELATIRLLEKKQATGPRGDRIVRGYRL